MNAVDSFSILTLCFFFVCKIAKVKAAGTT